MCCISLHCIVVDLNASCSQRKEIKLAKRLKLSRDFLLWLGQGTRGVAPQPDLSRKAVDAPVLQLSGIGEADALVQQRHQPEDREDGQVEVQAPW